MYVIPAIDIIDGQCVRLTQGDFDQKKIYHTDPVEVAVRFEAAGLTRLHVVDLDGAKAQHIVNYKTLSRIAQYTSLHIDFGGGLKSSEDVYIAFESGAHQITGGTVAVKAPDLFLEWVDTYGPDRIILGADVRNGNIAVSGWQEDSQMPLMGFLEKFLAHGLSHVICTDVSRDGLLQGSALDLYSRIRDRFPKIKLIASGGVSSLNELRKLRELGCYGAIVGKAIYEGKLDPEALSLV